MKPETQEEILAEAAWYCLKPFIHPLDCNRRVYWEGGSAPLAMNRGPDLENLYNGVLIEGHGYRPHSFTKKALRQHLNSTETYYYRSTWKGRPRFGYGSHRGAYQQMGEAAELLGVTGKMIKYDHIGMVLLCADIDAHNGESDANSVRDWLLRTWFPGCYSEPSTGGKGVHLYIKLAYPVGRSFKETQIAVTEAVDALAARIDTEREAMGYAAPIDGLRGLPSLLFRDGTGSLRLKRSSCIKIPRFACGVSDVLQFHQAPLYLLDHMQVRLDELKSSEEDDPELDAIYCDPTAVRKNRGGISLNSAYPSYGHVIEHLRVQEDAFEKALGFCMAYSRHLGHVPDEERALSEYEAQGLATGADVNGRRRSRIRYCLATVQKTFKPMSLQTLYAGFDQHKQAILAELRTAITDPTTLQYKKAKGRMATVPLEDVAVGLFALRRSQGNLSETEFSRRQVRQAMEIITGRRLNRQVAGKILKALKLAGLTRQVDKEIRGVRGRIWSVCPAA